MPDDKSSAPQSATEAGRIPTTGELRPSAFAPSTQAWLLKFLSTLGLASPDLASLEQALELPSARERRDAVSSWVSAMKIAAAHGLVDITAQDVVRSVVPLLDRLLEEKA